MNSSVGRNAWLARMLPFLQWGRLTNRQTLSADLIAGITGAFIVLPQGLAFAAIVGLPLEYGLYTAIVPPVIAALFGSSLHLVSGPATAIAIMLFDALNPLANPGSAQYITLLLTLTFMTGLFQLAMGLARFGMVINFISHTVVVAFTAGAGILIISTQLPNFFGVYVPRGSSFFATLRDILVQLGDINPFTTAVALITLFSGILAKKYFRKIPYIIVAMIVGSIAAVLLNQFFGIQRTRITGIGGLSDALPAFSYPDLHPDTLRVVLSSALAAAILGLAEAVSVARTIAVRSEQRLNNNQEFIGQGLANIIGSFFSAFVASGSFNRSALNYEIGAKTPLAVIFSSIFLLLILTQIARLATYFPTAAMAGILLLVGFNLIDVERMKTIVRTSRSESAILFATLLATLLGKLDFAIYLGVILSLMLYLNRASRPAINVVTPDAEDFKPRLSHGEKLPKCPQLVILRIDSPLFFGATGYVEDTLNELTEKNPDKTHVLIIAKSITFIDISAAEMLVREARRLRKLNGNLYLCSMNPGVLAMLRQGGYIEVIGEENIFSSKTIAIKAICERLGNVSAG